MLTGSQFAKVAVTAMFVATLSARPSVYGQCAYDVSFVAGPDCGAFGSSPTLGRGINEAGQVVGQYTVCGLGNSEAFVWDGGPNLITLERPPGVLCSGAWAISNTGLIAGAMCTDENDRAFLHDGTGFIDLGVPPGAIRSQGRGINNQGDVVGKWGRGVHAFLYREGVMIDLGPDLGHPSGEAKDINDQGQVTGWMGVSLIQDGEAYIWEDGKVTALGLLPNSSFTGGRAINGLGQVVGQAVIGIFPNVVSHSFLWDKGQMIDLGLLPGFENGAAADINEAG